MSNEFTLTNFEMALLKIKTTDEVRLKKGVEVIAEEDVAMEIRYFDFNQPGHIAIDTFLSKPIKILFIIAPGPSAPMLTCGGDEYEISNSTSEY